MINACTILARNYLAHGRVLLDSFLACHDDGTFTTLVVDAGAADLPAADDRVKWLGLADLGLDHVELHRLAGIYDVTELCTAVKPILLRRLLDDGFADVVYLDPDIAIYAGLDDLSALARQHGIVLTPHTTVPLPDDGRGVDAFFILAAGIYNLGFIAVSAAARPFLDWWWTHTRRDAISDVSRMMFTDQRVVDFVPAFFAPYLLKDPGYNVAYWNLHARTIAGGDGYRVNGSPLRFFHFSGFDVDRPWLLSKNQGPQPRILLSEREDVRELCEDYAGRVLAARSSAQLPYGWQASAGGLTLTTRMRRLYRTAVIAAEREGAPAPPDPFDPGNGDAFLDWLKSPDPHGPQTLSRYLYSIYQDRVDLQVFFRDIHGADAPRFIDWLWQVGIAPERIPAELLPVASPSENIAQTSTVVLTPGLEIVLDPDDPWAQTVASALERVARLAGLPARIGSAASASHDIVLVVATPSRASAIAAALGASRADRAVVGYWLVDDLAPADDLSAASAPFDEIWVASDRVAESLRDGRRPPVFSIPVLPRITDPSPPVGVPGPVRFVQVVDGRDDPEQTRVMEMMDAFGRAFGSRGEAELTIRVSGTAIDLRHLERVRAMARGNPAIHIVDTKDDGLDFAGCDAYVALHRSERGERAIVSAMEHGLAVLATADDRHGSMLRPANSWLLDVTAPDSVHDLDRAARLMREIADNRGDAAARGAQARADVRAAGGDRVTSALLSERVLEIRAQRVRLAALPHVLVPKEASLSRHTPRPADRPAGESIASLLPQLESLATPHVAEGAASGGVRSAAQRLLFRVLRPYWFQQYQLHKYMIEAFGRVANAARQEAQQREALDRRVRELSQEVAESAREIRRLEAVVRSPSSSAALDPLPPRGSSES